MVEERRILITVAAPLVYTPNADCGVMGGLLEESRIQALIFLRYKYGTQVQSFMIDTLRKVLYLILNFNCVQYHNKYLTFPFRCICR